MTSKYISNGQERIEIVDQKAIGSSHSQATRWIVWNVTTQTTVSEHSTRKAAQEAFDGLDWCALCGQHHSADQGQPGYSCAN